MHTLERASDRYLINRTLSAFALSNARGSTKWFWTLNGQAGHGYKRGTLLCILWSTLTPAWTTVTQRSASQGNRDRRNGQGYAENYGYRTDSIASTIAALFATANTRT